MNIVGLQYSEIVRYIIIPYTNNNTKCIGGYTMIQYIDYSTICGLCMVFFLKGRYSSCFSGNRNSTARKKATNSPYWS